LPLFVAKNASIASLDFAFINGFDVAIFTHKNQEGNPTLSTLYKIGVRARVLHISKSSDGSARVLLEIKNRLEVQSFVSYRDSDSVFAIKHKRPNDINFSIAVFKDIKNPKDAVSLKIQRLRKVIVSAVTEMSKINPFKITEESLGIILKIENNDAFFMQ
jgi:ATP-dependent Lon protease